MRLNASQLSMRIACYAILLFWLVVVLAPIYWVLITSFKLPIAVRGGSTYIPWVDFQPVLDNWHYVLIEKQADLIKPFKNSLIIALGGTTLAVALGSMAGYALTRFQFKFAWMRNEDIAYWFISQRMLPPVVVVIPFLIFFRYVGLLDTQLGLIIAYGGFNLPLAVWITRDFFAALPRDIEESAMIDGCSRWQAFVKIALPLSVPGLVAAFVICFIFAWNEYLLALVLSFQNSATLPVYLAGQSSLNGPQVWYIAAMTIVFLAPVVTVGLLLERFITKGLVGGAVK